MAIRFCFILVFLASAIAANSLQWFMGDWGLWIVRGRYGVVGYVWLGSAESRQICCAAVYLGISLFFLLIGFANLDGILGVNMANGATWGLLGGLAVLGACVSGESGGSTVVDRAYGRVDISVAA